MNPTEKLEQMRLERLHTNADTIHSTGAVAGEICTFHGSGIGFQSNFAVRIDRKQPIRAFEDACNARRLKCRWGTPAEKNRLDASAAPMTHAGIMIQLLSQCLSVTCFR